MGFHDLLCECLSSGAVRYKDLLDDVYHDLSNLLRSSGTVCSIIYCLERSACDALSAYLLKDGFRCGGKHHMYILFLVFSKH